MAGIKRIKNDDLEDLTIKYILSRLVAPEVRQVLFDDIWGYGDMKALIFNSNTRIYGIFAEGKPEPVGVVFFTGVIAYRDCYLYAVVFEKEKRKKGVINQVYEKIKSDIIKRDLVSSFSANVVGNNLASVHILEKLGFKKIGTKKKGIVSGGKSKDLHFYYLLLEEE